LFALLAETGMRVGQALGWRHADSVSPAKEVHIVPRGDNANGARAKLRSPATIPVTAGLVCCYSDLILVHQAPQSSPASLDTAPVRGKPVARMWQSLGPTLSLSDRPTARIPKGTES
jgi:hypothetical protein